MHGIALHSSSFNSLTHWGRMTHICIGNLTIICSDSGLSPDWCQAIIWTNAGTLLHGPLWTNFSEISIEIPIFSLKKMPGNVWKMSTILLSLNALSARPIYRHYPNFITIVFADVLSSNGVRPSPGTLWTPNLRCFLHIFQNGQWNHVKSHRNSSVMF